MPLVTSLLTAIVRADGDALVLHAGERPYVVAPAGQLELASRALTLDAVKGMLNELLSAEARQSLDEIGAVQHELGDSTLLRRARRFSVVAARGGDDIWIEIRRQRAPDRMWRLRRRAVAPEPAPEPELVQPEPFTGADSDRRSPSRHPSRCPNRPTPRSRNRNFELEPELEPPTEPEVEPAPALEPEPELEPELEPEPELELEPGTRVFRPDHRAGRRSRTGIPRHRHTGRGPRDFAR